MDLVEGNITDHDYPSLVLERIKFLWLSKRLCDATLEAGPVKIYVHRLILHAAIPGLTHLQIYATENHLEVILPTEVKADALNAVVDYLYTGRLHLTPQNVSRVAQVTHLLGLEKLYRFCNQYQCSLRQKGIVASPCECFESPVIVFFQSEKATQVHYLKSKEQLACFQREHTLMKLLPDVAIQEGLEIRESTSESNNDNSELALRHSDFTLGTFGKSPCKEENLLFHIRSERSSSGTTSSQQRSSPETALSNTASMQKLNKPPQISTLKISDYQSSENSVPRPEPQIVEQSIKLEKVSDDEIEMDHRRIDVKQGEFQCGYLVEESKSAVKVSKSPNKETEMDVVNNNRTQRQLTRSKGDRMSEECKNTMLENERMLETTLCRKDEEINQERIAAHQPSNTGPCREFSSPPLNCTSGSLEFQSQLEEHNLKVNHRLCSGTSSSGITTSKMSGVDERPWTNQQCNKTWPLDLSSLGSETEDFTAFCPLCLINFTSRTAYTAHLNICFNTFHHIQQNKFLQREWTRQFKSAVSQDPIQSSTSGRTDSFIRSNPIYSTSTLSTDARPTVHCGMNKDTLGPPSVIKDLFIHSENDHIDKIKPRDTTTNNSISEFPLDYIRDRTVQRNCASEVLGEGKTAVGHGNCTRSDNMDSSANVGGDRPGEELGIRITDVWTLKDVQEEMKLSVNPGNAHQKSREQVGHHTELNTVKEKLVEIHMKETSSLKVTAKGNKLYIKRKNMANQSQTCVKADSWTPSESKQKAVMDKDKKSQTCVKADSRTPSESKQKAVMDKDKKSQTCVKSKKKVTKKRRKRKLIGATAHRKRSKGTKTRRMETVPRSAADGAPNPKSMGGSGCVKPDDRIVSSGKEASERVITQTPIQKLTNIIAAVAERENNFFLKRKRINTFGHTIYDVDASSSGKQVRRSAKKNNTAGRQEGQRPEKRKFYRFINPEIVSSPVTHQSPGLSHPILNSTLTRSLQKSPVMSPCAPSLLSAAGNVTRSPQMIPLRAPTAMKSATIPAQPPQLTTLYNPTNVTGSPVLGVSFSSNRRGSIAEKIASVYRENCIVIPKEWKEWTEDFPKPKETGVPFQYTMPLKKRKH
ncbi:uncharacterized protein LOC125646135 isoform X2 [Ostrea edulis]|uniref:uncharacterized protein LOC125646135 isoform X2 n=1 Tax=Ostrea edulis TaxID=37623 RepID=UPI0024AFAE86|nr:uncharacterized protein LOC125646135 isoform X2 [Ostrea edulis]